MADVKLHQMGKMNLWRALKAKQSCLNLMQGHKESFLAICPEWSEGRVVWQGFMGETGEGQSSSSIPRGVSI